jgi:hypothetical protein
MVLARSRQYSSLSQNDIKSIHIIFEKVTATQLEASYLRIIMN